MQIEYFVNWKIFDTDEEKKNTTYEKDICFKFLRNISLKKKKYLQVQFKNRLDEANLNEGTTVHWFSLLSYWKIKERFVEVSIEKDFYSVTLDLEYLSYESTLFLLTLVRYPGEYYNVCYNFWKINGQYPDLPLWKSFYLAHQGTYKTTYSEQFEKSFYYNGGHCLYISASLKNPLPKSAEEILSDFDKEPLLYSGRSCYKKMQDFWPIEKFRDYINFDKVVPLTLL